MDAPPRTGEGQDGTPGVGTIIAAAVGGLRVTVALLGDDRVGGRDKLAAAAGLAYLVSPVDLIPDMILGLGQLDDLGVLIWSWRRLLRGAGVDLVTEHWQGSPEALELLLQVAGLDD